MSPTTASSLSIAPQRPRRKMTRSTTPASTNTATVTGHRSRRGLMTIRLNLGWLAMTDACLSVVMPCFNEDATIATTVKRVLDSPYTAEVIVVDDGSTDASASVIESLDDPRVRL